LSTLTNLRSPDKGFSGVRKKISPSTSTTTTWWPAVRGAGGWPPCSSALPMIRPVPWTTA
jgi:hypothetical protein